MNGLHLDPSYTFDRDSKVAGSTIIIPRVTISILTVLKKYICY